MSGQPLHRLLQHIRDDLHPQRAARAAVRDDVVLRRVAHVVQHLHMMTQSIGIGLEQCPPHVRRPVRQGEPVEHAARRRIVDRRLLAEEIGQDGQALGTCRNLGCERIEILVDAQSLGLRGWFEPATELPCEPVEAGAPRRHAAVRHVEAGHQVIVEEHPAIRHHLVGGDEDVDRAAKFQQHVALPRDAGPQRRGNEIGGPACNRCALGEARGPCGLRGEMAQHPMRDRLGRNGIAREASERDQPVIEFTARHVDEASFQRPVLLDGPLARQPPVDVVV